MSDYYVPFVIRFTFVTLELNDIRIYKKCENVLLVKWGEYGLRYRKKIRRMDAHGGQGPMNPVRELKDKVTENSAI